LYQLPESGPRESDTLTEGGVASYLKLKVPPFATFPALSEHVPLKDPLEVSARCMSASCTTQDPTSRQMRSR
jgi:hypothetical protein